MKLPKYPLSIQRKIIDFERIVAPMLAEIISQINAGGYSDPHLEEMLAQPARRRALFQTKCCFNVKRTLYWVRG